MKFDVSTIKQASVQVRIRNFFRPDIVLKVTIAFAIILFINTPLVPRPFTVSDCKTYENMVRNGKYPLERVAAIRALENCSGQNIPRLLMSYSLQGTGRERRAALLAMDGHIKRIPLDHLLNLYYNTDNIAFDNLEYILRLIRIKARPESQAILEPIFLRESSSENSRIRMESLLGLEKINSPLRNNIIVEALSSNRPDILEASLHGARGLTEPDIIQRAGAQLASLNPGLQKAAIQYFASIPSRIALKHLLLLEQMRPHESNAEFLWKTIKDKTRENKDKTNRVAINPSPVRIYANPSPLAPIIGAISPGDILFVKKTKEGPPGAIPPEETIQTAWIQVISPAGISGWCLSSDIIVYSE